MDVLDHWGGAEGGRAVLCTAGYLTAPSMPGTPLSFDTEKCY